MTETPIIELDFEQMDKDLRHLSPIQKQEVLAAEQFGNFPPKTRAKHAYLTEKLDDGPNVFSVPAGVIAALLGNVYDGKQNRSDFKSRVLQKHPDYAKHWVSLPKSQVNNVSRFCSPSADSGDLEFPIPGEVGKSYVIRETDGRSMQYVFLTPIYARFLLSRNDDRLHTFFIKVHDEVRKMIRGEESIFATAMEVEAAQPLPQIADDERRLKLRRIEYELARDEAQLQAQTQREVLDMQREHIVWQKDFLKGIDAWDDRAKLHLKESLFNVTTTSGPTTARALLTNEASQARLEISQELIRMGKRPDSSSLTSIGQILARQYRAKYGEAPPKHQKEVNGEVRYVNMYFAKDRVLMHEAIQTYYEKKQKENAAAAAEATHGNLFAYGLIRKADTST